MKEFKILYNGSLANFNYKKIKPQGGPARFACEFRKFFLQYKYVKIIPVVFNINPDVSTVRNRETRVNGNIFYEIVHNPEPVKIVATATSTLADAKNKLKHIFESVEDIILNEKPNVVFLNGFSLYNWILLEAAKSLNVPVVVQHAGLWKKEIQQHSERYSSKTRKLFYTMERATVSASVFHIFLNKFSMDVFKNIHHISESDPFEYRVISLPIPVVEPARRRVFSKKRTHIDIGMVARWDSIKNHSATYRLATAEKFPKDWNVHSVTKIPSMEYEFPKKYIKHINVHAPMSPSSLVMFYKDMEIVIVPSHFDVSPTVVAEAFLAGVPVIISDKVGWINEFVACGLEDHIIRTSISGNSFVRKIATILENRQANEKKYSMFLSYIKNKHSAKKIFREYFALFKMIATK